MDMERITTTSMPRTKKFIGFLCIAQLLCYLIFAGVFIFHDALFCGFTALLGACDALIICVARAYRVYDVRLEIVSSVTMVLACAGITFSLDCVVPRVSYLAVVFHGERVAASLVAAEAADIYTYCPFDGG